MSTGSIEPDPGTGIVLPAAPTGAGPGASASYRPEPAWKVRGTRKPLAWWDRVKFLLLLNVLYLVLVWNEYLRISPLGSWLDAAAQVSASQRWIVVLGVIELVRQIHLRISELSAGYHRFWTRRVFGGTTDWFHRRFSAWTRFRLARVVTWMVWIAIIGVVLGKALNLSPVEALFQAPALIWRALPMIVQIVLIVSLGILQFVAIFWFMSRGGVETYFPDDIETRFSDVWGQDHVLERVKENVTLLERPEEIEARGGHVPSGILLWGPPGTGKTLMAEAVAGETGKPYVFVDPGAFTNMFFGVGILKVKALFRKLRKLALRYGGVIVFFDEADTLGSRGSRTAGAPGTATPAPWQHDGCSGFAHLRSGTRYQLSQLTAGTPFVAGAGMNGGAASFDGTLQALLTELSGLKKPRGFVNRVVRRTLGMRPKPPPKYRILVMMASNMPESLDPALLRPGRIDRIYRVGYPSKAGRVRTYEGYLGKVKHELTDQQIDKIATITPYFSGAQIKDLVNEALIYAIREGRGTITWRDVTKAKQLKELGPPENVEYIERERHAVAVHEACHAVLAWATRRHMEIDIATIEKGSGYLGMVASIPPEDQFTQWRSEYESDILVALASLAGERLFYDGDNSSGVSGDLESATLVAALMQSRWGMGTRVTSLPALQKLGVGAIPGTQPAPTEPPAPDSGERVHGMLSGGIEETLSGLLDRAEQILSENRARVLALAHALESHKTLTGDDVVAVLEGRAGPIVDGRPYADPAFLAELEGYHTAAAQAHRAHAPVAAALPQAPVLVPVVPELAAAAEPAGMVWAMPAGSPNGGSPNGGSPNGGSPNGISPAHEDPSTSQEEGQI